MIFKRVHINYILLAGFLGMMVSSCYKEIIILDENQTKYNYYVSFNNIPIGIDTSNRFMLCSVESLSIDSYTVSIVNDPIKILSIDDKSVSSDGKYDFGSIDFSVSHDMLVQLPNGKKVNYDLQFTPMPVLQIYTEDDIRDEPKIVSWVSVSKPGEEVESIGSYMGIEFRGGSASRAPKKSYGIEFWDDMYESGHKSVSFFGLLADDDWILDAMYVDRGRMRKALTFEIWQEMQEDRLPELPFRSTSSEGGYVEVFLNGKFEGLYHLRERIDRKRLGIVRSEQSIEGVIYKSEDWQSTTLYTAMQERSNGEVWGGWELKYPKDMGGEVWDDFHDYFEFAINSSDEDFKSHIFEYLDKGSAIDFLLLINMSRATDNYGKNVIMTKYDASSKYLLIPWDLDATWGRNWLAEEMDQWGILTNRLFDRLLELNPENYKEDLIKRWEELRLTVFDPAYIYDLIENRQLFMTASGAIDRENSAWPECNVNLYYEFMYMQEWYYRRWEYLDDYFEDLEEN